MYDRTKKGKIMFKFFIESLERLIRSVRTVRIKRNVTKKNSTLCEDMKQIFNNEIKASENQWSVKRGVKLGSLSCSPIMSCLLSIMSKMIDSKSSLELF